MQVIIRAETTVCSKTFLLMIRRKHKQIFNYFDEKVNSRYNNMN
jgi:hypothetical protein